MREPARPRPHAPGGSRARLADGCSDGARRNGERNGSGKRMTPAPRTTKATPPRLRSEAFVTKSPAAKAAVANSFALVFRGHGAGPSECHTQLPFLAPKMEAVQPYLESLVGEEEELPSFLPPFANAENRELDAQIRRQQQLLRQCENDLEEVRDIPSVVALMFGKGAVLSFPAPADASYRLLHRMGTECAPWKSTCAAWSGTSATRKRVLLRSVRKLRPRSTWHICASASQVLRWGKRNIVALC
eukprot:scaffold1483_cov379-Prasinococcus_capsulatus_cf.AAC.11